LEDFIGFLEQAGVTRITTEQALCWAKLPRNARPYQWRKRLGVVRLFARLVIAGLIAGIAIGGYAAYRIWDQGNRDERTPADAIVVMGAAQYDGRPSPVFAARLDHAIALYHDGVASRLIVTGGKREGDRTTEAASAAGVNGFVM